MNVLLYLPPTHPAAKSKAIFNVINTGIRTGKSTQENRYKYITMLEGAVDRNGSGL